MNFLQMVQALHREVGAAGVAPTTVLSQRGEAARMVEWVRAADMYVQNLWENWKFLREEYDEDTTEDVATLSAPDDIAMWDLDTFTITPPGSTDPEPLEAVEYDKVKRDLRDTSEGAPWRVIVMPDNSLQFEGVPDGAYNIRADYYRKPTEMSANDSISSIPDRFHMVVVGRAEILYANYENAAEIKTQGQEIFADFLARLENNQLPNQANSRFRTGGHFEVMPE